MNRIESAIEDAGFTVFAKALNASAFADSLENSGPHTLFAPTDSAFAKIPSDMLARLLDGDDTLTRTMLGYHLARGKVRAARFDGKRIRAAMRAGGDLIIDGRNGLRVNTANLTTRDIEAGDCIVHGIDTVLRPREPQVATR